MAGKPRKPRSTTGQKVVQPAFSSVYAIFEGGGAKGLAHVGALRAMEKAGLAVQGVAGTSAGAIFAALVAVGYTPDEIFKSGNRHILKTLNLGGPVELIGAPTWKRLKAFGTHGYALVLGIGLSTLLSTLLGAFLLGSWAGAERTLLGAFAAGFGAGLLLYWIASNAGLQIGRLPGMILGILAAIGMVLSVLIYPQTISWVAAGAGLELGMVMAAWFRAAPVLMWAGGPVAMLAAAIVVWGGSGFAAVLTVLLLASMGASLFIALGWAKPLLIHQGLVDGEVVRAVVNEALRRKLKKHWKKADGALPDEILFRHIDPEKVPGFIPLKVVTTNIDERRLVIFDHRNPDVPVAQAVAASAALPLIFRPAQISGHGSAEHRYADGGMVSNLPSWVFRDEKRQQERFEAYSARNFRRIPVYAIALKEPDEPLPKPGRAMAQVMQLRHSLRYFARLANTAVFGGQSVVQSFISDLRTIEIETTLRTMDLDCTGQQAKHQVDDAERQTLAVLRMESKRNLVANALLEEIHGEVLAEVRRLLKRPRADLRVLLLDPITRDDGSSSVALKVHYVIGGSAELNTDDELEIDLKGSIAARAFASGSIAYGQIRGLGAGQLRMTKYEHALLPNHLHSAIAVPILSSDGYVDRVLTVDSKLDLMPLETDKDFNKLLIELCEPLSSELFDQNVNEMRHDI